MGNIDNINPRAVVVRDEPTATTVAAAPPAPQPSEEIIRNLAAFLPKDQDDYVKVREDAKYYYVDIGRSKAVDEIYRPLHDRVSAIGHKYKASLQALLTQMLADQITNANTAVNATPSKTRAARKRPAPSTINKVVISRSKRNNTTTASTSNGSSIASSSTGGKTHPFRSGTTSKAQTTDDSISPGAIAGDIEQLQSYALELMSELSIDPNTTVQSASTTSKSVATTVTKKAKKNIASKKPFIANEESVVEPGIVILEESNASMPTGTAMKTRLRTRQATNINSLANSATKAPITKARRVAAGSVTPTSKATRMAVAASPKSLTNPKLNATPSKRVVIDLSATPSSLTSSRSRTAGGESSSNRQDRLIMSVEKSKKAEEKKKALLDSRINALKSEREKRLGKIAENKKAIDHEKEAKFKAIAVTAPPSGPTKTMTKAEARNAERRLKLAQLEQEKVQQMALKAEADALTTSKGTNVKATNMKATKPAAKNQAKKCVAKKMQQPQPKPVVQKPVDDPRQHHVPQEDVSVSVMSPIAKLSGFNGKINETFTQQTELPNQTVTTPKADVPMANSTFISAPGPSSAAQSANDGTFVMPNAPPPVTPKVKGPATNTATFNLAIQSQMNSTNNYEMTPPPVERTYDNNYDISQYVDSDDEEKQAELKADAKRNGGKHVPKWCLGKPFLSQVHAQFGMPPEQLAQWTQRLFPKPVLPVPLEDMGLNVRERYVQRSSSVNWKTATEIESVLKKDKDFMK